MRIFTVLISHGAGLEVNHGVSQRVGHEVGYEVGHSTQHKGYILIHQTFQENVGVAISFDE